MSQNRDMYEWGFLNQSGNTISAFSTFGVTGVQTYEGKLYLFASQPTEDGVVAVSGPQAVANGSRGICAFPGAHWARISGSASAGEEVGPVSGSPLLSSEGEGFVVVGGPISGRHLVAVRGGGAGGDEDIARFNLMEDKLRQDRHALARRVLPDGTVEQDPDANTDLSFYVVGTDYHAGQEDTVDQWEGFAETSGRPAHRGYAVRFTVDYHINGQPTGRPGYRILSMETMAEFIFVELDEDLEDGEANCNQPLDDELDGIGFPTMGIKPDEHGVIVSDDFEFAEGAKEGDRWLAVYTYPNDGSQGKYNFAVGLSERKLEVEPAWALIVQPIPKAVVTPADASSPPGTPVVSGGSADAAALILNSAGATMPDPNDDSLSWLIPAKHANHTQLYSNGDIVYSGHIVYGVNDTAEFIMSWPDLRAIPGFSQGQPPSGNDDSSLQVVYHEGGMDSSQWTQTNDCGSEE